MSHRSVCESRCTSPTGPWTEATARSSAQRDGVIPSHPDRHDARRGDRGDVPLDPFQRLLDVARGGRRITEVDGGQRAEDLDLLHGL